MALIARSLAEAFALRSSATSLLLRKSNDLICNNLMCEKVTAGCACKLALSLSRLQCLRVLDISHNRLTVLPDSLWSSSIAKSLTTLDISHNVLPSLPDNLTTLSNLEELDISHNVLQSHTVPWEKLALMSSLRRLSILKGNHPSCGPAVEKLATRCPILIIS